MFIISEEIKLYHKLRDTVVLDRYVYIEIRKDVNDIPQVDKLAYKNLRQL